LASAIRRISFFFLISIFLPFFSSFLLFSFFFLFPAFFVVKNQHERRGRKKRSDRNRKFGDADENGTAKRSEKEETRWVGTEGGGGGWVRTGGGGEVGKCGI
jgi:predicted membrane protein